MGAVAPEKIAKLLRAMNRPRLPVDAAEKARQRVVFEARGSDVSGWMGDTQIFRIAAPSGPAARAIADALRDLQNRRGTIF